MTDVNDETSPSVGAPGASAPRRGPRPAIIAAIVAAALVLGGGTAWTLSASNAAPAPGAAVASAPGDPASAPARGGTDAADTGATPTGSTPSDGVANPDQAAVAQQAEAQLRQDNDRIARTAETAATVRQVREDVAATRAALDAGADLTPMLDRLRAGVNRLQGGIVGTDGPSLGVFADVERTMNDLVVAATSPGAPVTASLQFMDDALLRLSAVVQKPR